MKLPTDKDAKAQQLPARPGTPGKYQGRRVRWRAVVRETRNTNKPAVAALVEAELAIKRRMARAAIVARLVRAVLVGGAIAAVVIARCSP